MDMLQNFSFRRLALSFLGIVSSAVAFANDNVANRLLEESTIELQNIASKVVTLVQVIMGLGIMAFLVMIILKFMKGDRESTEKLAWWVAGLVIGLVALAVVKTVVFGVSLPKGVIVVGGILLVVIIFLVKGNR